MYVLASVSRIEKGVKDRGPVRLVIVVEQPGGAAALEMERTGSRRVEQPRPPQ